MEQQSPQSKPRRPRRPRGPAKEDTTNLQPTMKDDSKQKPAGIKPSTKGDSQQSRQRPTQPQANDNKGESKNLNPRRYPASTQTLDNRPNPSIKSNPTTNKPPYNPHAWLKQNTGPRLTTISRDDLQPDSAQVTSTSKAKTLCSYNWHKSSSPAIYVPGAPPTWTARGLPITIPADSGEIFIDQNAHKMPQYPFEPLFRAIQVTTPEMSFDSVDFVANRNSLRKLLNFVSGKVWDPFRIDLNMVHNTLFFTRRERFTKEIATGKRGNTGYGHSFEDHFTVAQEGLEDSTSHHRAARYKFGDLDCVIRYEVDGYLPAEDAEKSESKQQTTNLDKKGEVDDLLSGLEELSLNRTKQPPKNNDKTMKVVQRGMEIDDSRLMELKSKSREPKRADLIPQLWFGRIPYLAIGIHKDGNFDEGSVTVTDTVDDFQRFETIQQDNLRKIVHVIKILKHLTMSSFNRACVVVCEPKIKPLELHVYTSRVPKSVLPEELIKRHWREGDK